MSTSKRKKERREQRKQRNIQKELDHKKEAWEKGKIIEENHNDGFYSSEFTLKISSRLIEIFSELKNTAGKDNERILYGFRQYRIKVRDTILRWNPAVEYNSDYYYLKTLIETYWDCPENLMNVI